MVLAFGVRRPATGRAPVLRRGQAGAKGANSGTEHAPQNCIEASRAGRARPERIRNQEIFEQVASHLKREPTQSSRLLQSWIHSD